MKLLTILLTVTLAVVITAAPFAPISAPAESRDEPSVDLPGPPSALNFAAEDSHVGPDATPGPGSAWNLSIEPSNDPSATEDEEIENLPALPGFAGMLRNESTPSDNNRYEAVVSPSGIYLDHGICKHVTLTGNGKVGETTLEAKCVDSDNTWWDTSLNLNECVSNDRGFLVFSEDGNFDESCRPCMIIDPVEVQGLQLKCRCDVDGEGTQQYAALPLGSHVKNPLAIKPIEGTLTCGNKRGLQTPSFFDY